MAAEKPTRILTRAFEIILVVATIISSAFGLSVYTGPARDIADHERRLVEVETTEKENNRAIVEMQTDIRWIRQTLERAQGGR